jgi:hypothetical protein
VLSGPKKLVPHLIEEISMEKERESGATSSSESTAASEFFDLSITLLQPLKSTEGSVAQREIQ